MGEIREQQWMFTMIIDMEALILIIGMPWYIS